LSGEEPEGGVTDFWRRRLTFRDGGIRVTSWSSFRDGSDSEGVEDTPRRRLDFRGGGVSASSWSSSEDESDSEGVVNDFLRCGLGFPGGKMSTSDESDGVAPAAPWACL